MYFRQFWTDERLNFESKGAPPKVDKLASAVLKTKVWVPDPFFANQVRKKKLRNVVLIIEIGSQISPLGQTPFFSGLIGCGSSFPVSLNLILIRLNVNFGKIKYVQAYDWDYSH